ncbi:helix-turn-helix domain-containing protein [Dehalobacter sp. TBBPA1]
MVENKESVAAVVCEVGLHENTVYGWENRYRKNSSKPMTT